METFFCGLAGQPASSRCWLAQGAGYAGRANACQRVENVSPSDGLRTNSHDPLHFVTPITM